ncbi:MULTISPECIES: TIGR01212 family radical SAM protein [Persephonella]|uniref:Radical SAM protein, family n=1 Tax=Persephonella marina (strain DSM 14350 / EX-H1) TaxID=123214 RepID=C0QU10_PERMH|nr:MULTISPECIES: TIGR01212 family radical SAM protein [Persephonella]ACO04798.1 radical SAM protein, family [Persephonella marina EX-H1]
MGNYIRFNQYLKEKYGGRIQKISIDAGFTCPNRDGFKGHGGCTFCNNASFSPYAMSKQTVEDQIEKSIDFYKKRFKNIKGFIAYFQAFSNTYAPVSKLKEIYDRAMEYDEIIGMSIGTRPDVAPDEALDLIATYTAYKPEIWIEYGLQTANIKTLREINRGHGVSEFVDAVLRTKKRAGIKVCAHMIVGLPGDTFEDYVETAKLIAALGIEGIKIHPLHIVKHTIMEKQFYRGQIKTLTLEEYADIVAHLLDILPDDIIVHRLTGEATEEELISPDWCTSKRKMEVLNAIDEAIKRRQSNKKLSLKQ